ncbi:MAG: exodeoxyribonuclease VII small subunit [Bacteroidales bacterium]
MAKAKEVKMSYEEAVAELEKIVGEVEAPDVSLVTMGDKMKRAMELIQYCKTELKGYQDDFTKIMTNTE